MPELEQPVPAPERPKRASGVVVPKPANFSGRLAARLIWLAVHALGFTVRMRLQDRSGLFAGNGVPPPPVIFCIWHNRLALCLKLYNRYVRRRDPARRMAAMVSASRDGGMLARALELFEVQPVRGSSSRRGPQALLELTTWAEKGLDLAITPDGPRGPRYQVQEGIIALAALTGAPVLPAAYRLGWKWTAKSWDGFQVPLPFATCDVMVGEPLLVPRGATHEERTRSLAELQRRMMELTLD